MPDLNDRLRRDGARWREQVDRQHALDPDPQFDRITSVPVAATPGHVLRHRFAGRAPLLLSVAAVTVAALAVLGGVVLASGSHDTNPSPPALAATGTPPAVSTSPTAPSSSAPRTHSSTSLHHAGRPPVPATSSATKRHKKKHKHPAGGSTSSTAGPLACDSANLAISVSSPASAGDHATLTVSVVNNGTGPCTIAGFPAVQFAGDSTVSATPTTDTPTQLTLAGGTTATAEVDWDGTSATGTCTSYPATLVSAPGGSAIQLPLDPPAQVCDPTTFVVHPLTAS